MPCRSDYLEQTNKEANMQRTAKLLVWFENKLGWPSEHKFQVEAQNYYAKNIGQVERLCSLLRAAKPETIDRIVYNARDSIARDLADWWEAHQEEDRKREAEEAQEKSDAARFRELRRKLSADDIRILKERLR